MGNRSKRPMRDLGPSARRFRSPGRDGGGLSSRNQSWLLNPSLSPDGDRLVYARIDRAGIAHLWISSLSGGAPIRLTNTDTDTSGECCGSWSPDGSRFVYLHTQAGKHWLMTVKTSGNAVPVMLKEVTRYIPDWSPVGDWITYQDEKGWSLISPDGKTSKFLAKIETRYLAFSKMGSCSMESRRATTQPIRIAQRCSLSTLQRSSRG